MKKLTVSLMAAFLLFTCIPMPSKAGTSVDTVSIIPSKEVAVLIARLNEIKAMDKSKLGFSDKKQLSKEVRTIKKKMRTYDSGVYISVGAIIIIILLLILLL